MWSRATRSLAANCLFPALLHACVLARFNINLRMMCRRMGESCDQRSFLLLYGKLTSFASI